MEWLIGHLVGDYIFQTDWMAQNKKKRTLPCLAHVLTYLLAIWLCLYLATGKPLAWPWWAWVITGVCHFIQDRTGIVAWFCRVKGSRDFVSPTLRVETPVGDRGTTEVTYKANPLFPWSLIVSDNVLHLVQLWATALAVARVTPT